jgi:hemerythrin
MFEWNDKMSLGIKLIDDQHRELVEALGRLMSSLSSLKNIKVEIGGVLKKVDEYAKWHFETEEKYFDEFKYAEAAEHKEEHKKFREKIADLEMRYGRDEEMLAFNLADYLEGWFLGHIMTLDRKYVECLHEHGLV